MTCKVRRDFEIITDVSSKVSLVTSNVRGSLIRSPKSLYKKTGNEILQSWRQLSKRGVKGSGGPDRSYTSLLQSICCDRRVSNSQLSHTHRHLREEGRRRNFSSCSDHSWIKMTAIFFALPSSLSISFSAGFFFYSTKRWSMVQLTLTDFGTFPFASLYIEAI